MALLPNGGRFRVKCLSNNLHPHDPLNPEHRAQRRVARNVYFQRTHTLPIAAMVMVVFVPVAMWMKPFALWYLIIMCVLPFLLAAGSRSAGELFGIAPLTRITTLATTPVAIALFVLLAWAVPPLVLPVCGTLIVVGLVFLAFHMMRGGEL